MSFAQPFTDYEILERVGAGAMGTVFKARQKRLERIVALKVLRPSLARNKRYVDRLRREAHIVARFNHPNIVIGYDLGEEDGYHFFVMEFVEGKALKDLLSEWGSFPEEQVLELAIQVASALDHAFDKGIIHRDIKPGNILIEDSTGRAKLTDLGLAKSAGDLTLTREGATVGTPQYISPEQARSSQDVDARSDLYSLGATLYHMATGQAPFLGDSMAEIITKVLQERAPSASVLNPELSDGLSLVIRKLMAKDPALRYQTPAELLEDLRRVERSEAPDVDKRRLDAADRIARPRMVMLRQVALVVVVLGALLGAMALGAAVWGDRREGTADDAAVLADVDELVTGGAGSPEVVLETFDILVRRASSRVRGRIEERRDDYLRRLQDRLDAGMARVLEDRGAIRAWLREPDHWRRPQDFVDVHLRGDLEEAVGFAPGELPRELDAGPVERVRETVRELAAERDRAFLEAYRGFLAGEYRDRVQQALDARDYRRAHRVANEHAGAFFGREVGGRGHPTLGQVGEELHERLVAARDEARRRQRERVREAEAAAAELLVDSAVRRVAALRQRLEERPRSLAAELESLRGELRERHPPAGHFADHRPWERVETELANAESEAATVSQARAEREAEDRVALAYGALVAEGDPRLARQVLERVAGNAPPYLREQLERHRRALIAAENVRYGLLETLTLASPLQVPRRGGGEPLRVTVQRAGDEFELLAHPHGASPVPVGLAELDFATLLDAARERRPELLGDLGADQRKRGILVWRCLTDDFTGVVEALDPERGGDAFVLDSVWPRIRSVREERGRYGPGDRTTALARLQVLFERTVEERENGDLEALAEALGAFRLQFNPDPGSAAGRRLAEIDRYLERERSRRRVRGDLVGRALRGAAIRVEGAGEVQEVRYLPEVLARGEAGPTWEPRGDGLLWGVSPPYAEAVDEALRLDDVVAGDQPVEIEITLTVPTVERPTPAVWLLRLRGVGLAIGLLGDDRMVAARFRPELIDQPEHVNRALAAAIDRAVATGRAGPRVVRDAVHTLRLELHPKDEGPSRSVRLLLDGAPVLDSPALRGGPGARSLEVVALHPLLVRRVRFATTRL